MSTLLKPAKVYMFLTLKPVNENKTAVIKMDTKQIEYLQQYKKNGNFEDKLIISKR